MIARERVVSETLADMPMIKAGTAKDLLNHDFGKSVHCLIVPGKLHFMEEKAVKLYS